MKFRKKPVVIEARQFLNDATSYELLHWVNSESVKAGREIAQWVNDQLLIPTLEGPHFASVGDWIIQGVAGEFYPCKPEIFEKTYEAIDSATGEKA